MATRARSDPEAAQARIAARAYAIWESEGRPHGCDTEHWLRAERELAAGPLTAPAKRPAKKAAAKKSKAQR
ncbi:MAG: DUF2934 domain-containing protein [Alphaproteobacteria bacterium]|nr:DUF2934 domain-containing protein [Alphaproteobacteria bacterium]MBU6471832.1 DUF2934 domain-containing protein [Alphaproteobacteria bacterium]MDE2013058.1 DUF2934 domain-containing protein [Alphaproteobacteria bacterium]MDE2075224.1 DUF2934 domain-containing protein [Alphaproteobacteria bacterium]MDE2352007.1 DUF2934 domain-containing protein [Alphaproteobacteria bacterium]